MDRNMARRLMSSLDPLEDDPSYKNYLKLTVVGVPAEQVFSQNESHPSPPLQSTYRSAL